MNCCIGHAGYSNGDTLSDYSVLIDPEQLLLSSNYDNPQSLFQGLPEGSIRNDIDQRVQMETAKSHQAMIDREASKINLPVFKIGSLVTLKVPVANRLTIFSKRLICKIIDTADKDTFILRSEFGIISCHCSRRESQLVPSTVAFMPDETRFHEKITTPMAAKLTQERKTGKVYSHFSLITRNFITGITRVFYRVVVRDHVTPNVVCVLEGRYPAAKLAAALEKGRKNNAAILQYQRQIQSQERLLAQCQQVRN